jgi:hypothetical protein
MLLWLSILLRFIIGKRSDIFRACRDLLIDALWALLSLFVAAVGMERIFGAWLSLVERTVRDREVGGSNPLAPTISLQSIYDLIFRGPVA